MERELEQRLEAALKERVMNLLMERNPVDVPAALVADEAQRLRNQAKGDLTRAGHSSALELPCRCSRSRRAGGFGWACWSRGDPHQG